MRSVLCATVRGKWEEIWREAQCSDEVMVYLTDWVGGTLQDWGISWGVEGEEGSSLATNAV